jgi:hypothetical protein
LDIQPQESGANRHPRPHLELLISQMNVCNHRLSVL